MGASSSSSLKAELVSPGRKVIGMVSGHPWPGCQLALQLEQNSMSQALHCTSWGVCGPSSCSWHTAWQADAGHQVRQGSRSTSLSNCSFLYLCIISAATMHSISFSCRWPCLGQAASGQLIAVSNPSLIKSSTYCFRHRVQKMHWHWEMVVICSTGYSPRQSLQETSGSRARSQVGRYRAVVIAEQSDKESVSGSSSSSSNSTFTWSQKSDVVLLPLKNPQGKRGTVFQPTLGVLKHYVHSIVFASHHWVFVERNGDMLWHQGSLWT